MLHIRAFLVHKLTGIKISKMGMAVTQGFLYVEPWGFHCGFGGKDEGIMVQIEKECFQDLF
jgi:hypothetical protein